MFRRSIDSEGFLRSARRTAESLPSSYRMGRGSLKVVVSDSSAEREADAVADRVLRGQSARDIGHPTGPGHEAATSAEPIQISGLGNELGSARPLDAATRSFFEPRFGHSFAKVRVFSGPGAVRSARALGARAYTVGQEIVFGDRQYAPATVAGRALLAHELSHVAQQRTGGAGSATGAAFLAKNEKSAEIQAAVQQHWEEMKAATKDTEWRAVLAAYQKIEDLGDEAFEMAKDPGATPVAIHRLGADAARALGDTTRYRELLARAQKALVATAPSGVAPGDPLLSVISDTLAEIDAGFGAVRITARSSARHAMQSGRPVPELHLANIPFNPDVLKSIKYAEERIAKDGSFSGLLPVGDYALGSTSFTVVAGEEVKVRWGE